MDMVKRTQDIIRKMRALLPVIEDVSYRNTIAETADSMEQQLVAIIRDNIPCSDKVAQELEIFFTIIDDLYKEKATN